MIKNPLATTLELISRLAGNRIFPAYKSSADDSIATGNGFGNPLNDSAVATIDNKVISDTYYTTEGMYDLVPIQYQNISVNELDSIDLLHEAPYQSAQRRGQFIYSRFMDISGTIPLYNVQSVLNTPISPLDSLNNYEFTLGYAEFQSSTAATLLTADGDATDADFIWAGTFGRANSGTPGQADLSVPFSPSVIDVTSFASVTAEQYNTGIYLHKEHPDLENLYADSEANAVDPSAVTDLEQIDNITALVNNAIHTMPITATLESAGKVTPYQNLVGGTPTNAKKQLGYMEMSDTMIDANSVNPRSFKMSFDANDQYLLGGKSVGSFLFLSPINTTTLSVNGETKQSLKPVASGEANGLSLDVVFQYRMTDYYGNDSQSDLGRIGGLSKFGFGNLTYTKTIGLDLFDKHDNQFSFDLEIFAKYSSKGKNLNSIRAAQLVR